MNNILRIQVSNYEGVMVEIDTEKVPKQTQDFFVRELQPERFKVWETVRRQTYFVEGIPIVTMPLKKVGYHIITEDDNFIVVNSKLPRAERTKIVRDLLKHKR